MAQLKSGSTVGGNEIVTVNQYYDTDVLNKIKNVDGNGSGLDADLLDGNHASFFATSDHGHSITNYNIKLQADVAVTPANTYTTAVSISLPSGTYLVLGHVNVLRNTTTATTYAVRITDLTNHYASGGQYMPSVTNHTTDVHLSTIITLNNTTTIYLQVASDQTSTIKAALNSNGTGNNSTQLTAIRLSI